MSRALPSQTLRSQPSHQHINGTPRLLRRSRRINPTRTQKLTNAWHLLDIHYSDTSSEFQKPECILNQNSYSPSEPLGTYCSPPRRWWKRHIRARFRRIKGLGIGDFAFAHAQTGTSARASTPVSLTHTHTHWEEWRFKQGWSLHPDSFMGLFSLRGGVNRTGALHFQV